MTQRVDVFLGIGQRGKIVNWLERRTPDHIHFHGAPKYLHHDSASEIVKTGISYVCSRLDDAPAGAYILIAESQASASVVQALNDGQIPLPQKLVLLEPLGLNSQSFGDTESARMREFYRRVARYWLHPHQSLLIWGNRYTAYKVLSESIRHWRRVRFGYVTGLSFDLREPLSRIAQQTDVHVYAGENDEFFPYHEIAAHLDDPNITFHKLPGGHVNRATPRGFDELESVLDEMLI